MLSALSLPLLEEKPIKTHPLCLLFLLRMLQEAEKELLELLNAEEAAQKEDTKKKSSKKSGNKAKKK
jgi:hypothetical protein